MLTIYQIRCRVNNKVYIGKTMQPVDCRWKQHATGGGNAPYLYRAIKKYGPENFDVWVLYPDAVSEGHLNMLEEMFIKQFKANDRRYGYNLTAGGTGLCNPSSETRRKIGLESKRRFQGKRLSKRHKGKISKALKGKKKPPFSKTHLKNLSLSHQGQEVSIERRELVSLRHTGKKVSRKTRKILRKLHLLRWANPEFRMKAIQGMRKAAALRS